MLVYLADLAHDFPGTVQYTPTGIGYLAASARAKLGDRVELILFKSPTELLDAVDARRPDLVGLTNYTWNAALSRFAGQYIRELHPDLPIVMGGPNIRIDEPGIEAFLSLESYVDKYAMYAGEGSFASLLEQLLDRPLSERTAHATRGLDVDGMYSLRDGRLVGNANAYMPDELDEIPSPFTTGVLDSFLEKGFIPILESNRGCPFSCTFCVWGISALSKVRKFSMDRIKAEISYVVESEFNSPILSFADANFGILPRDVEIAKHVRLLYDRHQSFSSIQFYWSKTLKPHMVEIGRALGHLTHTYIAFQSLDPLVLENIKRKNIKTDQLMGLIQQLKAFTSSTQTDILVGLPGETYSSHLESIETALSYGIDLIHGGEIRMLPGSEMDSPEDRHKFGLKTKYRLFEGGQGFYRGHFVYELEEVVRATHAMTEREMLELRVLRAIFYGAVTLGELLPVVAYLKSRGLKIMEFCSQILRHGDADPDFKVHLDWLRTNAEAEWFDTLEDARGFFDNAANQSAILSDGAFVKLNIGFLARLYLDPSGYEAYYRVVARAAAAMAPSAELPLLQELLGICRARNYLVQCLRADASRTPEAILPISRQAAAVLKAGGFVPPSDASVDAGQLDLAVHAATAQICERFVEEHRQDMTTLRLSQTMLTHAGRFMKKPRRLGALQPAEDAHAEVSPPPDEPRRVSLPVLSSSV